MIASGLGQTLWRLAEGLVGNTLHVLTPVMDILNIDDGHMSKNRLTHAHYRVYCKLYFSFETITLTSTHRENNSIYLFMYFVW